MAPQTIEKFKKLSNNLENQNKLRFKIKKPKKFRQFPPTNENPKAHCIENPKTQIKIINCKKVSGPT